MYKITNLKDLDEVVKSGGLQTFFISSDAENAVMEALYDNMHILQSNYGDKGEGGYICILTEPDKVREEYSAELQKFYLADDGYEYDTILAMDDTAEIHLRLFVMTEYHLLLLFKKQVGAEVIG